MTRHRYPRWQRYIDTGWMLTSSRKAAARLGCEPMTKPNSDPRVDAYIAKAPEFARPILAEARARVHQACPAVEETIKWNVPFFLHQGKMIANMAAFKQHTKVGVWDGMNPTFVDVKSVDELPAAKAFVQSVKEAARRVED